MNRRFIYPSGAKGEDELNSSSTRILNKLSVYFDE